MLSLRLSEEEYQLLLKASVANGSRSVSDYARDSIFRLSPAPPDLPPGAEILKTRMDEFETELQSLHRDLRRLQQLAESTPETNQ